MKNPERKTKIRIALITSIMFITVSIKSFVNGTACENCDTIGFPFRFYAFCPNTTDVPIINHNPHHFYWIYFIIDILCVLIPVVIVFFLIGLITKKLKP